ncbi:MAG: hypothetical protein JXR94_15010 [Candidatus Hydrogenedentes bacterium]|nr:hypothetical protein [Candidatus Hydrogenedentota bacterium]
MQIMVWRKMRFVAMAAVTVLAVQAAWAQSDYFLWLNPKVNDFAFIGEADAAHYASADVDRRPSSLAMTKYTLRLRYPFARTESSEWIGSLDVGVWDLEGAPKLQRSRTRLPGELYDLDAGATYRRFLDNGWLVGGNLRLGSASDEPFTSFDETRLGGTGFVRIPHLEYTAWLLFLDADTGRDLPIVPGFGYQFPISKHAWAVVGVPILAAGGKIGEKVGFNAVYAITQGGHAEVSYAPIESVKAYAGFDWDRKRFLLAGRDDSGDRLEFEEKRAYAGVEWAVTENWALDLGGGYAFDRSVSEGDDDHERNDTALDIEAGWFVRVGGALRF